MDRDNVRQTQADKDIQRQGLTEIRTERERERERERESETETEVDTETAKEKTDMRKLERTGKVRTAQ